MPVDILSTDDFTDSDIIGVLTAEANERTDNSKNKYLYRADEYYNKLLRDRGIESDDPDLADPVTFEVKEVLMHWTLCQIYSDKIDYQEAMFENVTVVPNKYRDKMNHCAKMLSKALIDLDDGAFKDLPKSDESEIVNTYSRY